MLKRLVGKLFGFEAEIIRLEEQVDQLSFDDAFGMWTRGAFLQFCHVMPRGPRIVAFIDLNKIHILNEEYGYLEVDHRVRETFAAPFRRRSDVVARWYSGDEIVILFDSDVEGAEGKMAELGESAAEQGLTFYHALGEWEVGKAGIQDVVEELADKVAALKGVSPRTQ